MICNPRKLRNHTLKADYTKKDSRPTEWTGVFIYKRRAIHDNTVFNCSGKHISPIADAVYILWQMQYIFFGG